VRRSGEHSRPLRHLAQLLSSNVQVYIDLQDHEALKAITGVEVTWESDPRAFTIVRLGPLHLTA
jgi:hypothetical protein